MKKRSSVVDVLRAFLACLIFLCGPAWASTALINGLGGASGFGENSLTRNDDGSSGFIDVSSVFPQGLNLFGTVYTGFFINNNGNVTFRTNQTTFTPPVLTGPTQNPLIAPFFADVDTRSGAVQATPGGNSTGANLVHWDLDPTAGIVTVTWDDVGFYLANTSKLNAFQLRLLNRGGGDFDIEFRYEDINWTTGDESGGTNGLGGTVARAGWNSGNGTNYVELPQSGNQEAMLALDTDPGVIVFNVRSGVVLSVSVLPQSVSFDELASGGTASQTVTIANNEPFPVTVDSLVLLGDDLLPLVGGHYTLANNQASGTTLQPGQSATFDLVFAPQAGGVFPGIVRLNMTGGGRSSVIDLPVSGSRRVELKLDKTGSGSGSISSQPVNGTDSAAQFTAAFSPGTQVTLTAAPATNSVFKGWASLGGPTNSLSHTLTLNTDLAGSVSFVRQRALSVAATPSAGGTVSGAGNYDEDSSATISARAEGGYRFVRWDGEGVANPSSGTTTVTMSSDRSVTAQFIKIWAVSTTADPGGSGTITAPSTVDDGVAFTLTAAPGPGYRFLRWSQGEVNSPNSPVTTAVAATNVSFTAQFQKVWTLSALVSPIAGGSVTGGGVYDAGLLAPITAVASNGYEFSGWQGAGVADPSRASTSVLMDTNRQVTALFTVRSPDLVVTDLQSPAAAASGERVDVQWTVRNVGNALTDPGQWQDNVILSTDQILGNADDRLLGSVNQVGALAPQAEYTRSASLLLPARLSGPHYIFVVTDAAGRVQEINAENNNASTPPKPLDIQAAGFSDLRVAAVEVPASATIGSTIPVAWVLENTSNAVAPVDGTPWNDAVYLSSDNIFDPSDERLFTRRQTSSIPLSGNLRTEAAVTLPARPVGQYFLFFVADDGDAVYEHVFESNNVSEPAPVSLNGPDLTISSLASGPTAIAGRPLTVEWVVANQGAAAATGTWKDRFWLSTDTEFGNDRYIGEISFTGTIPASGSINRVQTVDLPPNFQGSFYLLSEANGSRELAEVNFTNNRAVSPGALEVRLPDRPNLSPDDVIAPLRAFSGQPTLAQWIVRNNGAAATGSTGWEDAVYLSRDDQWSGDDIPLGTAPNPAALQANEAYASQLNVTLPQFIQGTYYFIVASDVRNRIDEVFESDNVAASAAISVELSPTADLQVPRVVAPAFAFSGEPITATWDVENAGAGATVAAHWQDRVYLSTDQTLDASDILLGAVARNGVLDSGATYTVSATFTIPVGLTGNRYLLVEADAARQVFEDAFEDNNTGASSILTQINLTPPPDLAVTDVSLGGRIDPGVPRTIRYTVENLGATQTPNNSWRDRVFLSQDEILDDGDLVLASESRLGRLDTGQSYQTSTSITVPADKRWGFVIVATDDQDSVFETDNANNRSAVALSYSSGPDLVPAFAAQPVVNSTSEGYSLSVVLRTTNAGDAATPQVGWINRVYLSSDETPDIANATLLAEINHEGRIAAGAAVDSRQEFALSQAPSGNFFVLFVVDATHLVPETGEGSANTARSAAAVTLPSAPDLSAAAFAASPNPVLAGSPLTIQATVTNTGGRPTLGRNWVDRIFLSTDPELDPNEDRLWAEIPRASALDGGESYNIALEEVVPYDLEGDYFLFLEIDAGGQIVEANETNNRVALATTVRVQKPLADLIPRDLQLPAEVNAGFVIDLTYQLDQTGAGSLPADAEWTDRVFLSQDPVLDDSDILIANAVQKGPLATGESLEVTLSPVVPANVTGPHYLIVQVNADGRIAETDTTNNVVISGISPPEPGPIQIASRPPDLEIISLEGPSAGAPGSFLILDWAVRNRGIGSTYGVAWQDGVYLSANAVFGDGDETLLGRFERVTELAPSETYAKDGAAVDLPGDLASGDYFLFVVADADGLIYEGENRENNVSLPLALTIERQLPDLSCSGLVVPAAAAAGGEMIVDWTVTNIASVKTSNNFWYDSVFLSADAELDETDVMLGSRFRSEALEPGALYSVSRQFIIPAEISGSYYVIVQADARKLVNESREDNNLQVSERPVEIGGAKLADLECHDVRASSFALAGQKIPVSWRVVNSGEPVAGGWFDTVYLSRDQVFDPQLDVCLGFVERSGGLPRAEGYSASASLTIPAGTSGDFYVIVKADGTGRVPEPSPETNNVAVSQAVRVEIPAPGDLTVTEVLPGQTSSFAGDLFSASFSVLNQGKNSITGSWIDKFYLSLDLVWDVTDVYAGQAAASQTLGAWQSYSQSFNFLMPGLVPGNYHLIARTDIFDNVVETDERNNAGASQSTITVDLPVLVDGVTQNLALVSGQSAYHRFAANEGDTVAFNLEGTDGINELYVAFGRIPTRADFDFSYPNAVGSDQEIVIPSARAGNYYVFTTVRESPGLQPLELTASIIQFGIRAVGPEFVGNAGRVTVRVDGAKFTRQTAFLATDSKGSIYPAVRQKVIDSTSALVTFNLAGAAAGPLSVTAQLPSGPATTLAAATTVVNGGRGGLALTLESPASLRPGQLGVWYVNYRNTGLTDVDIPVISFRLPGATFLNTEPTGQHLGELIQFLGLPGMPLYDCLPPGAAVRLPIFGRMSVSAAACVGLVDVDDPLLTGLETDWSGFARSIGVPFAQVADKAALYGSHLASFYRKVLGELASLVDSSVNYRKVAYINGQWQLEAPAPGVLRPRPIIEDPLEGSWNYPAPGRLAPDGIRRTHVVIVGVGDYSGRDTDGIDGVDTDGDGFPDSSLDGNPTNDLDLPSAVHDADLIYDYFHGDLGVPASRITLLTDAIGESGDLVRPDSVLAAIANSGADADDNLVVYFSGHGRQGDGAWWMSEGAPLTGTQLGVALTAKGAGTNVVVSESSLAGAFVQSLSAPNTIFAGATDADSVAWSGLGSLFTTKLLAELRQGRSLGVVLREVTEEITADYLWRYPDTPQWQQAPVYSSALSETGVPWAEPASTRQLVSYVLGKWREELVAQGLVTIGFDCDVFDLCDCELTAVILAVDPNDILGPAGFGDDKWVSSAEPLGYTIRFENDPVFATASAQLVEITQQLDPDLDPRTFRLGSFGFGDRIFDVPANRSFYQTRLDLRDDIGYYVDVVAFIDVPNRTARWVLQTIDPATGEPPADATAGFLPPNLVPPEGDGFVSYTIRANRDVQTGAVIDAEAVIVFDTNEPIDTPPIFNTIDAVAPATAVASMPGVVASPTFAVSWAGADDPEGSALAGFSIFVSTDGAAYEPWLSNVQQTSAAYPGTAGHTYAFVAVGTDNAGNLEALPSAPDATVTVANYGRPVITSEPADATVLSGLALTLSVEASSATPVSYQWFRGNAPIVGATGPSLVVEQAAESDAGEYFVRVSNDIGPTDSRRLTVVVRADSDGDQIADDDETGVYGTDPTKFDSDGDGLGDYDELFIWNTLPLVKDTDGDGFNDYAEVYSGRDPTDPNDFPVALLQDVVTIELGFVGAPGQNYTLLFSTDLVNWQEYGDDLPGTGSVSHLILPVDRQSGVFYKLQGPTVAGSFGIDRALGFEFPSRSGVNYVIQQSDDLREWTNISPTLSGTGDIVRWTASRRIHQGKHFRVDEVD